MSVAFVYHPIFLDHDTGSMHPENANRLRSIIHTIEPILDRLFLVEPSEVSFELLHEVHPEFHRQAIEEKSMHEEPIDADTQLSSDSYKAALIAAGSGVKALDLIESGKVKSAFCAVRPPGHHATDSQAMGFCLFNNIAIAARYAQSIGYEKVMIVDFDVHHGNGTQEIFYKDPSVFYFSSHQYPAYPGTGSDLEIGSGEGEGYTHNFPLQMNSGDDDIIPIYEEQLLEDVGFFQPDIILVSAGYDLHAADPLAQLQVSTDGIGEIVDSIMNVADVPKLFMLEGGYNLSALAQCVDKTLKVMLSHSS